MKVLITIILGFLSCSALPGIKERSLTIRPGEVRWLDFKLEGDGPFKLICRDQEIKLTIKGKTAQAVVLESYFSELKPFECKLTSDTTKVEEIKFTIETREYKAEQLKVDPKKIKLAVKDEKRVWDEQKVLDQLYASSPKEYVFTKAFQHPMNTTITSVYGTKRVYNNQKKGQHLGTDYRAAVGDPVPAANAGKVVLARDLFYTGWTVIIDHGMDIFTVYGHCSKTLVKEGEMVERGQVIALSGNTGRTSGPHLHWGVKIQGQYIDGAVLIDETKKFFNE